MMMFWMLVGASVFAAAVMSLMVLGAAPNEDRTEQPQPDLGRSLGEVRFFGEMPDGVPTGASVPIEVVLDQIEHHVRLEQAAAETFLATPTRAGLRADTSSPLVN